MLLFCFIIIPFHFILFHLNTFYLPLIHCISFHCILFLFCFMKRRRRAALAVWRHRGSSISLCARPPCHMDALWGRIHFTVSTPSVPYGCPVGPYPFHCVHALRAIWMPCGAVSIFLRLSFHISHLSIQFPFNFPVSNIFLYFLFCCTIFCLAASSTATAAAAAAVRALATSAHTFS